ncbi:MAG: alpha-amylase family glycosyl hydrolase [Asticcacaulis sp.]|uniref:alpha-amylase family glycosyl hydrolase n=1 Tax=Asticcacaulis sp. TaxID=1872648 RepID=UPI003F7C6B0C
MADAYDLQSQTPAATRLRAQAALRRLYGDRDDFEALSREVDAMIQAAVSARPAALRALDADRANRPHWFLRPGRPAYCAYIDRFSGTLAGCAAKIPYLKSLGVGLFHPLPLLKPREGDSDGGFAVADYRQVDPRLGDFDDLIELADVLRENDISLVLDVVCNHTAKEHVWAQGWLAGDPRYKDFYIGLKTLDEVEQWSETLHEVFPDTAPGNFTWDETARAYVWTTFYPFQWDLNYANPRVFLAVLGVLFDLANAGVEGFRLDSAAYLWKIKGTACRNLPQAHDLLRAFKDLLSLAAPGVFLLAEAIEGLDEVLGYFGDAASERECDMAYNNTAMTALWGALADKKADVFAQALGKTKQKPAHGVWLNYARCHDDIIWQALSGWVEQDRLRAWSSFYASGERGLAFQAPGDLAPSTCGMAASLSGLAADAMGLERLKLAYGLTYALDGVPMLYMGDEIALLNDETFLNDPERRLELRWLHRPRMDWARADERHDSGSPAQLMFSHILRLNHVLGQMPDWSEPVPATPVPSHAPALLVFERALSGGRFVCLANLSGESIDLSSEWAGEDLISGTSLKSLAPYQLMWSRKADGGRS